MSHNQKVLHATDSCQRCHISYGVLKGAYALSRSKEHGPLVIAAAKAKFEAMSDCMGAAGQHHVWPAR